MFVGFLRPHDAFYECSLGGFPESGLVSFRVLLCRGFHVFDGQLVECLVVDFKHDFGIIELYNYRLTIFKSVPRVGQDGDAVHLERLDVYDRV